MQIGDQLRAVGLANFPCWVRHNPAAGRWDKGPDVPKGVPWLTVALNPGRFPALRWDAPVVGLPIPDGVLVFDLDTYKGATREQAEQVLGGPIPWDRAFIQRTIGGGEHYAFRCPWPAKQDANIGMRGLDTRAAGRGFVCTGEGYSPVGYGVYAMAYPAALPELPEFCRPMLERVDTPAPAPAGPPENVDADHVVAALAHIDPGCSRPEWRDLGFALKAIFREDPTGLEIFERWSAGEFWPGGCPANFIAEGKGSPADQWATFKAEGKVQGPTLFYRAMAAGWSPPATFDTAAAFGSGAAAAEVFAELVDRVRSEGGDARRVPELVGAIQGAGCNPLQLALLAGELKQALRDAGIKGAAIAQHVDKVLDARPSVDLHPGAVPDPGTWLADNQPIHPTAWAPMHTKGKDMKPRGTIQNFRVMLAAYGVAIQFDEIGKTIAIRGPSVPKSGVLHEEAALSYLVSLANLNDFPAADVQRMIMPIAHENTTNPARDFVASRPWDGIDHVGRLWQQFTLEDDEDAEFCEVLFRKWLRGAYGIGAGLLDRWEHCIVLIDPDGGVGKTRFFATLCPPELQTDSVILDPGNKDSVKMAISYWLTELGELDGTFSRSESARIKAFLALKADEMRLPYGRAYLKYPRRTAFWASVNETHFLIDPSDNRRFWGMRVAFVNHLHGVDVQQVWAQAAAELHAGHAAHLSPQESQILKARNDAFRTGSPVVDALGSVTLSSSPADVHYTVSEILAKAGAPRPSKADLNEAARWLRRMGFRESKRGGRRGFSLTLEAATAPAFRPTVVGGPTP